MRELGGLGKEDLLLLRGQKLSNVDPVAAALSTFAGFLTLTGVATGIVSQDARAALGVCVGLILLTAVLEVADVATSVGVASLALSGVSLCVGLVQAWMELGVVPIAVLVGSTALGAIAACSAALWILRRGQLKKYGTRLPRLLEQISRHNSVLETLRVADELAAVNGFDGVDAASTSDVNLGLEHVRSQLERALRTDKILRTNKHVAPKDLEKLRLNLIEASDIPVPRSVIDAGGALREAAIRIAEMQDALRDLG